MDQGFQILLSSQIGKGSLPIVQFIVTGDDTQVDLPRREDSGLVQAIRILDGIKGISIIRFDDRDIIRHRLVKVIVKAYNGN